jgi:hypothetical protein
MLSDHLPLSGLTPERMMTDHSIMGFHRSRHIRSLNVDDSQVNANVFML